MRSVPAPAFLRVLRLLLPLVACGWGPTVTSRLLWSRPSELVHLYTASTRRSFHLAIYSDGSVNGSVYQTVYTAMVVRPVERANVSFIGVKSKRFLCMHSNGNLYGSRSHNNEDCVFKHSILETCYDVYESIKYNCLVSLGSVKGPLILKREVPRFSQFLTRTNEVPLSELNTTET